jgi:hypothetical protein
MNYGTSIDIQLGGYNTRHNDIQPNDTAYMVSLILTIYAIVVSVVI